MELTKTRLLDLYKTFFKIGLFTFGGGLAALPMLEREIISNKNWATDQELLDYYAVSQTTPGIIMVNVATFIGYKQRGLIGGIIATLGVVSPSLIIISLVARLIDNFADYQLVKSALKGINAGVCAIILASLLGLYKKSIKDITGIILCILGFAFALFTDLPIILIVVFGIVVGVIKYKLEVNK